MDKDTIDMASTSSANAVGDHLQGAASGIMSDDQSMNSNEEDKSNSAYHDDEETASAIMQFDPSKGIKEPSAMDILCGRGRTTSSHPANRRFRELVNRHKDAYQRAKRRDDKTKITYELVELLRSEGRFVLFDPKTKLWYEVSEDYAREKVSHSLRSRPIDQRKMKPKIKKKVKKQPNSPAVDDVVRRIIDDQQSILRTMMQKETNRMTAEAIIRATLQQDAAS